MSSPPAGTEPATIGFPVEDRTAVGQIPQATTSTRIKLLAANRKVLFFGGGLAALLGALGTLITLGQAAASTMDQTVHAAVVNQASVDAAMQSFLSPGDWSDLTPDAIRARLHERLSNYHLTLTTIQKQESALRQAQSTLGWLGPFTFGSGPGSERYNRADCALAGLGDAEQVLTAAVDQETIGQAVFETMAKEQLMLDALKRQQYMEADRIDPEADLALLPGEWRMRYKDVPPQMSRLVGVVRLMIDSTDSLAVKTFRSDVESIAYDKSELRQAIDGYNDLSSTKTNAQNNSWNASQYGPKLAAYDDALNDLRNSATS